MKFPRSRILVFAKAPEPGTVKTRLIPLLGKQETAKLHTRFVHNTLDMICRANLAPAELWCSPSIDAAFFQDCRQRFLITLHQQPSGDLGHRMHLAIRSSLGRSQSAVLVGADCPGLCAADLTEAFEVLDRGAGAVLGPARDGGYYLIGLKQPNPRLFDIPGWGTATVLADTVKRLEETGIEYHCLTVRDDVDTPEDYLRITPETSASG